MYNKSDDFTKQHTKVLRSHAAKVQKTNMPELTEIGLDGVDHVNVWEYAQTNLGKALNTLADLPFVHDAHGQFKSIEGFWFYIRCIAPDEKLREVKGTPARKYCQKLEADPSKLQRVPNFRRIIADACWQKITAYPVLAEELKSLTIPLDGYFVRNEKTQVDGVEKEVGVRVRVTSSIWVIPALQEIRLALQENRKPDFRFLTDRLQGIDSSRRNKVNLVSFYGDNSKLTKLKTY